MLKIESRTEIKVEIEAEIERAASKIADIRAGQGMWMTTKLGRK
jgi:hypothetical protein